MTDKRRPDERWPWYSREGRDLLQVMSETIERAEDDHKRREGITVSNEVVNLGVPGMMLPALFRLWTQNVMGPAGLQAIKEQEEDEPDQA